MGATPPESTKPVCLITGGTSGIGLSTANLFASKGYDVAICGRRNEALESAEEMLTENGAKVYAQSVDLNEPEQASAFGTNALAHLGRIDVLVNNAGNAPLAKFEDITVETFETCLNVNVRSLFHLTQIVWKHMLEQGSGTIVNISSLAAVDPFPGFNLYGSAKAWIDLLTVALAAEGADHGIRVCSVRPGAVETPMLRNLFPDFPADQCVSPQAIADTIWGCVKDVEKFPTGGHFEVTNQPQS